MRRAVLDRFLEHAEIMAMNGKSYRLRRRGAEPTPADQRVQENV